MSFVTKGELACSLIIAIIIVIICVFIKKNYKECFQGPNPTNPLKDMCSTLCPCNFSSIDYSKQVKPGDIADAITEVEAKELNKIEDPKVDLDLRIDNLNKISAEMNIIMKRYFDDLVELKKYVVKMSDMSRVVPFQKPIMGSKTMKDFVDVYFISLMNIVGQYISILISIKKNINQKNILNREMRLTILFFSLFGMERYNFGNKKNNRKNFNNIIDIHNKLVRDIAIFEGNIEPGSHNHPGMVQLKGNGIDMFDYNIGLKKIMKKLHSRIDNIYNPDGELFLKFEEYFNQINKYNDADLNKYGYLFDKYKKAPFHITEYATNISQ